MSTPAAPPPLTPEEIETVAKSVASMLSSIPSHAGIIAAVLTRAMSSAKTREAQDRAGASVLKTFAELPGAPTSGPSA